MTAATASETEAMTRASAVYHRVMCSEWPAGKGDDIREALEGLTAARETYSDVLNGITHPAAAYPELEHEPEAFSRALAMAVQDAGDWAAELDRLVPERSDEEGEMAA